MSDIPAPLGFCTDCLADREQEVVATTTFGGNALCSDCNEAAQQIRDQQSADAEELTSELKAKRRAAMERFPPR